jgi:hypothetical protein
MAQITEVTSEALQSVFRRLLPSQSGFGEDLQATNVITPIIDLTPSAEGSSLPSYLQTALAFGSNTSTTTINTTNSLITDTGFHRITGTCYIGAEITGEAKITITDGSTTKSLWEVNAIGLSDNPCAALSIDFTAFLRAGDSISATTSTIYLVLDTSTRQVADINGNLVNPVGFTAQ